MAEETTTIAADVADLVTRANAFTITNAEEYQAVAAFLLGVKAVRTKIADTFDPHIARAVQAHRALLAEKRDAEAGAVQAEAIAKRLLEQWDRARRTEADALRLTLDEAADAERRELLDTAEAADAFGEHARADELRVEAAAVSAPLVAPPTPKVEGVSIAVTWRAEVTDLGALIRACANSPAWYGFLKPDTARLNTYARSLRERFNVPGVRAVSNRDVRARSPRLPTGPTR